MSRTWRYLPVVSLLLLFVATLQPALPASPVARVGDGSDLTSRELDADTLLVTVRTGRPLVSMASDLPPGFSTVSITGLPSLRESGRPSLPYRSFLVGIPAGKRVEITARAGRGESLGTNRLAPYYGTSSWEPGDGQATEITRVDLEELEDREVFGGSGSFPAGLAILAGTGMMRDQPIAEIRVHPVSYIPSEFELIHRPVIHVIVKFVDDGEGPHAALPLRMDPDPEGGPAHLRGFDSMLRGSLINYQMIARDRESLRAALSASPAEVSEVSHDEISSSPLAMSGLVGAVKLSVAQDRIYRVRPSDLTAAGVDVSMIDPRTFHLTNGGVSIPIGLLGESDGVFDPSDWLLFYGRGITGNRFTRTNIYRLAYGGTAGPAINWKSGLFTGPPDLTPTSFQTTLHAEQDRLYTAVVRPGVNEAWFWDLQTEGDPNSDARDYGINVPGVSPVAHSVTVRARMLGLTNNGHTPRLKLNGTQIAENTFVNQILFTQTSAPVSSSLLTSGSNTIQLELINNGNFSDRIASDYFEIDYRRTYAAVSDRLICEGQGTGKAHITVSNLSSNFVWVIDVTNPNVPRWVDPQAVTPTGGTFSVSFEDILTSNRRYGVFTDSAVFQPAAVVQDFPSNLKGAGNGADWILITDRSLITALEPLRAHRAAQGLRAVTVAVDDIYDEFNFGIANPDTIKSFLTHAYLNWNAPAPTYVVLGGDGHVDYRDDFGSGSPQIVPPKLLPFSGFGEAPSDNYFVAVAGGDVFPEMFVGRLPIRSAADATTIVNNIITYETAPPFGTLNQRSLFVADNNDPIFAAILDNLSLSLPPTMSAVKAYLPGGDPNNPPSQAQVLATRDAIISGFNTGSLLATYLGHGNVGLWAKERMLEHIPNPATGSTGRLDANLLTNSGFQSFLLALNCINGYFVDLAGAGPGHIDYSLAEEWLRRPNRGAIAAWAPSALGQLSEYDGMAYELYSHLFDNGQTAMGPAAVTAVVDAVGVFGIDTENVQNMIFFGDPATNLALDYDNDGLRDSDEAALGSNRNDTDSDDDGIRDGVEVSVYGTSPALADSDGDGLFDGTEAGLTTPDPGTATAAGFWIPDADPLTTTNPTNPDTDGGGVSDGDEDLNKNGAVDPGETDPNDPLDDLGCTLPAPEATGVVVARSGSDLALSWTAPPSVPCATYRIYAATNAGFPKSSITPFVQIGTSTVPTFTHVGAWTDGNQYDYLIVIQHPTLGPGPFGHYGQ